MKTACKHSVLLLLALLLCIPLSACNQKSPNEQDETKPPIGAQEAGITSYGKIAEADFPDSTVLREWYDLAKAREYLTNTVLYAKDEAEIWHCWLYIGSYCDGDTLEVAAGSTNGEILFRHTAQNTEALGFTGAFYFTIENETEPTFTLYQNEEFAGLLQTHADSPTVKK